MKSSYELGTAVFDQIREQEQQQSVAAAPDEDASLLLVLAASSDTEGDLESVYARLEQVRLSGDATDDMAHRVLSRLIDRAFECVSRRSDPANVAMLGCFLTRAGCVPDLRPACRLRETKVASRFATELARSGAQHSRRLRTRITHALT